jgi:hypothetical protein
MSSNSLSPFPGLAWRTQPSVFKEGMRIGWISMENEFLPQKLKTDR